MKNFNLISKSAKLKLSSTLALVLISGSLYAGGGLWSNNNSNNNKSGGFGNNKNIFNKKNSFKKQKIKKFKQNNGKHGGKGHNPKSVPLDGGLSILLLGAAAFGVKKLRDNS